MFRASGRLSVRCLGTAFGVVGAAVELVLRGGLWVLEIGDLSGRVLSRRGLVWWQVYDLVLVETGMVSVVCAWTAGRGVRP